MTNVVDIKQARDDREHEVDQHIDRVIDSTRQFIRGSAEASDVLTDIGIIRGVWMGLSIELFPQHYRDGKPAAEEVVAQIFDDITDLVDSTIEKQAEESTTH